MPPRICIIPQSAPNDKSKPQLISLPHPRTGTSTRYLLHPTKGVHEFTQIPTTTSSPRSWLLHAPKPSTAEENPTAVEESTTPETIPENEWLGDGHILRDGVLYLATPLDPLFLLLPILLPEKPSNTSYIPLDDIIDSLIEHTSPEAHWAALLARDSTPRRQIESRVRAVSDSVPVGEDTAYRINADKVLAVLTKKCEAMAKGGLPTSMEEEFVSKPLIRPVTEAQVLEGVTKEKEEEVKGSETKPVLPTPESETAPTLNPEPALKSELSTVSDSGAPLSTPPSEPATLQLEVRPNTTPPVIIHLLRLRVASQFLSSLYLPAYLSIRLLDHLSSTHAFDTLDSYLAELRQARTSAAAARAGDFSIKRSYEDIEESELRAEKKRKKEEEEKNAKKNISHGVRALGKVNTRGMAKMTSFFKKKEA